MIDEYVQHSSNVDSPKPPGEDATRAANFKLLYRNSGNPERDKSYGGSSDEETTSSSLVPIPDSLRQMRKELKKTISDIGEASEMESSYTVCSVFEKGGKFRNSLDKLRQMYSLKNETSVAVKMNSANLMLDDILASSNAKGRLQAPKNPADQGHGAKTAETTSASTTEGSVSSGKHCRHVAPVLAHPHFPFSFDFVPHLCPAHGNGYHPRCSCPNPSETGLQVPSQIGPEENPRKKSLVERIQNLHLKYRINSVYRKIQNSNPFVRGRKDSDCVNILQGIPGAARRKDSVSKEAPAGCKCEVANWPSNQYPKMVFNLMDSSRGYQSESKSTNGEEGQCTCFSHRDCSCPEILYRNALCTCGRSEIASDGSPKENSSRFEPPAKVQNNEVESKAVEMSSVPQQKDSGVSSSDESESGKKLRKDFQELKKKRIQCKKKEIIERTDIYYFDHGNSAYYRTTDNHPLRFTECLVDRTDEYATKFWAEFFGSIAIGMAFIISFVLQLYRFFFTSIIRPLTVGLLQIFSDYFFKPLLTIVFNGLIQPCLILAYNIATSLRDLCLPISQIFGFFAKEVANIFRSCRLVEINHDKQSSCNCGNKV